MAEKKIQWLPLESNPDVLNKFVSKLGVSTSQWQFCDVFGTDPELLLMIPRPVIAVLLLFPITDNTEKADSAEAEHIKKTGGVSSNNLWFMKQTVGNACGTVGVIHSVANNLHQLNIPPSSHFGKFFEMTKSLNPDERARVLETYTPFAAVHQDSAKEGQTTAVDEDVNLHFIAFVHVDGILFELDGRKSTPISHGKTSADTLLEDSIEVVKKFMSRDPEQVNFSMLALTGGV